MGQQINVMVGGEAGQGVQSVGFIIAKAFARGGYHVFADQDYESRVRGGHNFYRIRASDSRIGAIAEPVDILLALNGESVDLHRDEVAGGGVIIFDEERPGTSGGNSGAFGIPVNRLAEESAGNKLMSNTVALGAALGLVKYDSEILERVIREHFGSGEIGDKNVSACRAGYQYALENYKGNLNITLGRASQAKRMLLNGNEAIALGAIAAGCKFMAAYPMTPATSIMEYIAAKADEFGIALVPAEDEIAAINMVVGAGYAGVRSMTVTSGSGFCLMVEGLGMSGITETPIVVVNAQRPGPAVGLPTRTEQGDLQFIIHAHHGEFPRAVLAPATVQDCFWLTVKAFNLADKYQIPVVLLTDQHLAASYATVEKFDLSGVTIDKGLMHSESDSGSDAYKRHQITPSGISPRALPGQGKSLVVTDSDEHDEEGHLIEDGETRTRMVQKRMRKLFSLKQDIAPPRLSGAKKADTLLIGWGSTSAAIEEAAHFLREEGLSVNSLHFNELWPFPGQEIGEAIDRAEHSYVIESNSTGQLASLIRAQTGKQASGSILKYDGRPFTPAYIAREVKKEGC